MSLLTAISLSAGYGAEAVVRDVSFELGAGEFCALLGLNGCGKTTLLKAICGLLPALSGRCIINGADCARLNERSRARLVSYIPQRLSKLIGVSALDAVMMGFNAKLGLLEFPSAEDRLLAKEAMERMGIMELAHEDFSHLSEGRKQSVVLARMLVQNTPVMLMDEPDSALDFPGRYRALGRIARLIRDEGKAGLVTLHDPNLALAYCDRLLLMHDGAIFSDLRVADMSRTQLSESLMAIYGNVTLQEHNNRYTALYEEVTPSPNEFDKV